MEAGMLASAYATAASAARPGDPVGAIDWGMVGAVAAVVGVVVAVMVPVAIARWQERQTKRRGQVTANDGMGGSGPAFDQPDQLVEQQIIVAGDGTTITLGPGPAARAPVGGASLTAPLGLLPATVRGRDALLDRLRGRLQQGGLVVLTGPGGVGKSTIARELIRRVQAGEQGNEIQPWWLSGANRSTLVAGLVSVARQLGASDPDLQAIADLTPDAPDRLWGLLEQAPRRWLLVIDNADDAELLAAPAVAAAQGEAAAIPKMAEGQGWARAGHRGLLLVTSRQRSPARWGVTVTLERVDDLGDQDAALVLLDLAPAAGDQEQAEVLARRLGGLPLALHMAGSYLGSEFVRWRSFEAYGQALDREPAGAWSASPEAEADERATVMRTWELSLDDLARQGVGQARALLRLLCCFAPALPIPLDLLEADLLGQLRGMGEDAGGEAAAMRLERGLHGLSSLGLIEAGSLPGGERAIVVHPVIVDTNRAHLLRPQPLHPDPTLVRQAAVALLERSLQALNVSQSADWPRWRLLAPHLQALLEHGAAGLDDEHLSRLIVAADKMSNAHAWMGTLHAAEALTAAALAVGGHLGDDHPARLYVRGRSAYQAGQRGRWGDAEATFREVLEAAQRVLGDDHPSALVIRHELARAVAEQGRWGEAEATLREVLEAERRVLGDDHPSALATRHELAWAVANQGRWGEAEAAFHEVLEARRRVLGDDHPSTLATRHELVRTVAQQGKWGKAEAAFRELLEAQRRVLSDDHPSTLNTRNNLAWAVANQGRWGEAEAAFRELQEAQRRVLSDDHPSTLNTRNNLAWAVANQGRWGEAEAAFREVLEAAQRVLGDDHPSTLSTRHALAREVAEQGRWGEAEVAFREVLEARRRVLGDDHPSTITTYHNLAWMVREQGRWGEAEAAFREVLEARRRVLGDEHPSTITTRHNLALMVAEQGRWGEAEAAFRELLEVRRRVLGDEHPDILSTRGWIDECVRRQPSGS